MEIAFARKDGFQRLDPRHDLGVEAIIPCPCVSRTRSRHPSTHARPPSIHPSTHARTHARADRDVRCVEWMSAAGVCVKTHLHAFGAESLGEHVEEREDEVFVADGMDLLERDVVLLHLREDGETFHCDVVHLRLVETGLRDAADDVLGVVEESVLLVHGVPGGRYSRATHAWRRMPRPVVALVRELAVSPVHPAVVSRPHVASQTCARPLTEHVYVSPLRSKAQLGVHTCIWIEDRK